MKPIKISDIDALEKLTEKLNKLLDHRENMNATNAHWRKYGTMKGFRDFTDEAALKLDEKIRNAGLYSQPFPQYAINNNNGVIKNTRDRIEKLNRIINAEAKIYDTKHLGFEVVENKELMRIQIIFYGKPNEKLRTYLKSNGFKWAPSQGAWQRHLNDNGRYAVKRFVSKQNEEQSSKTKKNDPEM